MHLKHLFKYLIAIAMLALGLSGANVQAQTAASAKIGRAHV